MGQVTQPTGANYFGNPLTSCGLYWMRTPPYSNVTVFPSARHLIQLVVLQFALQGALTIALVLVHHRSRVVRRVKISCPPAEAFRPEGFVALLLKKARACRVDLPRNTEGIEFGFARACATAL